MIDCVKRYITTFVKTGRPTKKKLPAFICAGRFSSSIYRFISLRVGGENSSQLLLYTHVVSASEFMVISLPK